MPFLPKLILFMVFKSYDRNLTRAQYNSILRLSPNPSLPILSLCTAECILNHIRIWLKHNRIRNNEKKKHFNKYRINTYICLMNIRMWWIYTHIYIYMRMCVCVHMTIWIVLSQVRYEYFFPWNIAIFILKYLKSLQ